MTLYGLSCGYWTDVKKEHTQHRADHEAAGDESITVVSAKGLPKGFADMPGALRGCADGLGAAEPRGEAIDLTTIDTPEDYTLRSWFDAKATHLHGGVELTDVPTPEPHPNEVATREAVKAGHYAAEDVGVAEV